EQYSRQYLGQPLQQQLFVKPDVAVQSQIAEFYQRARSQPHDPHVRAAYAQMGEEVRQQHAFLTGHGFGFEPYFGHAEDYPSSAEMVRQLAGSRQLRVYASELAHPLLGGGPDPRQNLNWQFRGVHDVFGHAAAGFQFGPRGEENAWLAHSQMFSPLAAAA